MTSHHTMLFATCTRIGQNVRVECAFEPLKDSIPLCWSIMRRQRSHHQSASTPTVIGGRRSIRNGRARVASFASLVDRYFFCLVCHTVLLSPATLLENVGQYWSSTHSVICLQFYLIFVACQWGKSSRCLGFGCGLISHLAW